MEDNLINLTTLRIYFRYGESINGQSFFKRLWGSNLGTELLKRAKTLDIQQAALYVAKAGYLENGRISTDISELPSESNPVCIELIDSHDKLQLYIQENKSILKNVNIMLMNPNSFQVSII